MSCVQCQGIEELFSEEYVAKELKHYRKRGPDKTTKFLIEALKKEGVEGLTLLDIGGGLGAIQHAMLGAGAQSAVDIDASWAYLNTAKKETARRGYAEKVNFQHGNFVDLAANIPPADIVTLDRVICCFPDMHNMVGLSVARARKLYGLVYPRTDWWVKVGHVVMNFFLRLTRSRYQSYVHPRADVEDIIQRQGFKRRFYRQTLVWQVVVYSR